VDDWLPGVFLVVFATHLPWFAWRWRKTGELRFAATTLTFALLTVTYALRVFAPEAQAWGRPLWTLARVPAWTAAAVSLYLAGRHAAGRIRAGR
jgi:hypothetical protein